MVRLHHSLFLFTQEFLVANMSYCRFQNTRLDMQDCLYALEDKPVSSLSVEESKAAQHLYELAKQYIATFEESSNKKVCDICEESDNGDIIDGLCPACTEGEEED